MGERQDVVWIEEDAVLRETEKAIQVENARGEKVWLPRSELGFYQDGRISVPRWLADDREVGHG